MWGNSRHNCTKTIMGSTAINKGKIQFPFEFMDTFAGSFHTLFEDSAGLKSYPKNATIKRQSTYQIIHGGFLLLLSTDGAKKGAADLPSSEPSCSWCVDCQATAVPFSVARLSITGGILVKIKLVWKQYLQRSVFGRGKVFFTRFSFCSVWGFLSAPLTMAAQVHLRPPRSPP